MNDVVRSNCLSLLDWRRKGSWLCAVYWEITPL